MYSWSPNLSQISLKNSLGKWISIFRRNPNEMKIGYLAAILKRHDFPPWNMVVISAYTYGVKIFLKIRWESGFLTGVPSNTNGRSGYLRQLSVIFSPGINWFSRVLRVSINKSCKSWSLNFIGVLSHFQWQHHIHIGLYFFFLNCQKSDTPFFQMHHT